MAVFMLDTDAVSSVGDSFNGLAKTMDSIANSVGSYDTSCSDGNFDFNSAKSAIQSNIAACSIKINNIAIFIDDVVASHIELQNSLKFDDGNDDANSSNNGDGTNNNGDGTNNNGSGTNNGTDGKTGDSSNGGGNSPTGSGSPSGGAPVETSPTTEASTTPITDQNGVPATEAQVPQTNTQQSGMPSGGSPSGSSSTPSRAGSLGGGAAAAAAAAAVSTEPPIEQTSPATNPIDEYSYEVLADISETSVKKLDPEELSAYAQKLLKSDLFEYDENGYARYAGMFVIACDAAIGKVGDLVKLKLDDGTEINCIVAENTEGKPGEISFFINDEWDAENPDNISVDLNKKIDKVINYKAKGAQSIAKAAKLPEIGENTLAFEKFDEEWNVIATKIDVADYEAIASRNGIIQKSGKYGGSCLAFSYVHASNLYNGITTDTQLDAGTYRHASEFDSFFSPDKKDTLDKIYSELVQGRPVVLQVNGNEDGTERHFVTVVGFKKSVTDAAMLTEKDLLVMDSSSGMIERMDQGDSRFMITGEDCGKGYKGYYLRTLKVGEE